MSVREPWGRDEDARLRGLAFDGYSAEDIAAQLGRSQSSVLGRMQHFRLSIRVPEILDARIRRYWGVWTVTRLSRGWGVSAATIAARAAALGLDGQGPLLSLAAERHERARWALANRHTDREAALLCDMARVSQGERPVSRGYAA